MIYLKENIYVTFGHTFYKVILSYIIYAQKFKVQNATGSFYLKIKKYVFEQTNANKRVRFFSKLKNMYYGLSR
jgi:hypothetical protein